LAARRLEKLEFIEIDPWNFGVCYVEAYCFAEVHSVTQVRAHSDSRSRLSRQQYWMTVMWLEHFVKK
jgi:hypothetical protein